MIGRWFSLGLVIVLLCGGLAAADILAVSASLDLPGRAAFTAFLDNRTQIMAHVVRQTEPNTCGPAALATLLGIYGLTVTEAQVKKLAGTGESGTSMHGLATAARALGFTATGFRLTLADLGRLAKPVLVFIDGDHFAVLTEMTAAHVLLLDPAAGWVSLTLAQFCRRWHGETLVVRPHERD